MSHSHYCHICGRMHYEDVHVQCARTMFSTNQLPTVNLNKPPEASCHSVTASSYLISMRLDRTNKVLEPSVEADASFILKVPLSDIQKSRDKRVELEWLTMCLAKEFGIPTASIANVKLDNTKALIIKKVDRDAQGLPLDAETLHQASRWNDEQSLQHVLDRLVAPLSEQIDYALRAVFSYLTQTPACHPSKLIILEDKTWAPAYGLRLGSDVNQDLQGLLNQLENIGLLKNQKETLIRQSYARANQMRRLLRTIALKELCPFRQLIDDFIRSRATELRELA